MDFEAAYMKGECLTECGRKISPSYELPPKLNNSQPKRTRKSNFTQWMKFVLSLIKRVKGEGESGGCRAQRRRV